MAAIVYDQLTDEYGTDCTATVTMKKLEWCDYSTVENFWRYVYSFRQNPRTWQTDRQTPHDGIGRACIASRGKNGLNQLLESILRCVLLQQFKKWGVIPLAPISENTFTPMCSSRAYVCPLKGESTCVLAHAKDNICWRSYWFPQPMTA